MKKFFSYIFIYVPSKIYDSNCTMFNPTDMISYTCIDNKTNFGLIINDKNKISNIFFIAIGFMSFLSLITLIFGGVDSVEGFNKTDYIPWS